MLTRPFRSTLRYVRRIRRLAWIGTMCGALYGCSMSDIVGDPAQSTGSSNTPDAAENPEGALQFYHGVLTTQATAVSDAVLMGGYLSDELGSINGNDVDIDSRHLAENQQGAGADILIDILFKNLQIVRGNARQGRGILAQYLPDTSSNLLGHLYAIEAMSDVQLAELFCSGIPLSTVNYDGTVTLRSGSSSTDVYLTAIALFDSAMALTTDSTQWLNFAKVGKGRALLDMGNFQGAAAAVADVPLDFQYVVEYSTSVKNGFTRIDLSYSTGNYRTMSREGATGYPFGTARDWRTDTVRAMLTQPVVGYSGVGREPQKYSPSGMTPIILASGVEALLIRAEADLRAGGTQWLGWLNQLRNTCVPGATCSPVLVPLVPDTALPPINDPISVDARVDTLFGERAAWLYLTGHREGDLRRLIRQYQRDREAVFPKGLYTAATGFGSLLYTRYGTDINLPIPIAEHTNNSKFTGCMDRGA